MFYQKKSFKININLLSRVDFVKKDMIPKCSILSKCYPTIELTERIKEEKGEISLTVAHYYVWHVFLSNSSLCSIMTLL